MNLVERVSPDKPKVSRIWRFFSDSAHRWSWQRLAFDGTVIERSKTAYSQYEACLANASEHGYVSFPSLSTKADSRSAKVKRSYIRLAAGHQKLVSEIVTEPWTQKEDLPIEDALDGD